MSALPRCPVPAEALNGYKDRTKTVFRLHRVDSELTKDGFAHPLNRQTLEFSPDEIDHIHAYTGWLAPGATGYVDVVFKDKKKAARTFVVCGHPAIKLAIFEARLATIRVIDQEFTVHDNDNKIKPDPLPPEIIDDATSNASHSAFSYFSH